MTAARLLMAVNLTLDASILNECLDFFSPPHGSARTKLDRLGKTAGTTTFPPRAFTDGDEGKNLGQTEKAVNGDGELVL